jgi:cysteine desulfurase family protein
MDDSQQRIYLDNAATSWPKPLSVIDAISGFYQQHGSAALRSTASDAIAIDRRVAQVRQRLASFIGASQPEQLVFTFNGTDSLNMAIRGVVRPGMHVVTTALEHNSVLRPLHYFHQQGQIRLTTIGVDESGHVDVAALEDAIVDDTGLICVSHVSNVLGTTQPVEAIGDLPRPPGCLFLVDAAQSIGHLRIDVAEMKCDLLAASGHKGLLGPLGTGVLYVGEAAADRIEPLRLGGTGSNSESLQQPSDLPHRLESGNLNVAGILGLGAGLQHLHTLGLDQVTSQLTHLRDQIVEGLRSISGVQLYAANSVGQASGAVSFNVSALGASEVESILEQEFAIQSRAGLHCAPLAHETIGTDEQGGTVRVSPGIFNTATEIESLIAAVTEIAAA